MILFVSLLTAAPSWSEGTSLDDLVERDGLSYKKFTDVPFTGEIDEGLEQGSFKNGERKGPWVLYWRNGQLRGKGVYKNGKEEEGPWVYYHDNGQLRSKGDYKNGKREGRWVYYHDNGQLSSKGDWKNGEWEGPWVWYSEDGIVIDLLTGTYKNGEKISD